MITEATLSTWTAPSSDTEKDDIVKAIDVYAELYEIKLKLDKA